jgi:hypothetical protein
LSGNATGNTTVVFSDENKATLYKNLVNLVQTFGDRSDQKAARTVGAQLLKVHFNEDIVTDTFDGLQYQTSSGGIALFPYSNDDLALTAKLADVAPEYFNQDELKAYFNKIINDPKEGKDRVVIALYGLASLGDAVLVPVNQLINRDDNTPVERLYLALASAKSGNKEYAKYILENVLGEYGEDFKPYFRVNTGRDQDDILEATALAANLAGLAMHEKHKALLGYIENNNTKDILVHTDKLAYLKNVLPQTAAKPVTFTYSLNGETIEKTLNGTESHAIQVSAEALPQLAVQVIEGSLGIVTKYAEALDSAKLEKDGNVSISRSYSVNGKETKTFTDGSLVKVTLQAKVGDKGLDGCYQVTDTLPSGLRIVNQPYYSGIYQNLDDYIWYPYEVSGQQAKFCANKGSKPIVYYARVIGKGSYVAEQPTIQSLQSPRSFNIGVKETVTIQ